MVLTLTLDLRPVDCRVVDLYFKVWLQAHKVIRTFERQGPDVISQSIIYSTMVFL